MITRLDTYTVDVGGERFVVPLRSVGPVRIAYLDFLCDVPLIQAASTAVRDLLPSGDGAIVVPATGAIALGYAVATAAGRPLVVLRKEKRGYMGSVLSVPVESIASSGAETLVLEDVYLPRLQSAPTVLLDTVTTSGGTLRAMRQLMDMAEVRVAATMVVFVEGDESYGSDILSVGHLPVF